MNQLIISWCLEKWQTGRRRLHQWRPWLNDCVLFHRKIKIDKMTQISGGSFGVWKVLICIKISPRQISLGRHGTTRCPPDQQCHNRFNYRNTLIIYWITVISVEADGRGGAEQRRGDVLQMDLLIAPLKRWTATLWSFHLAPRDALLSVEQPRASPSNPPPSQTAAASSALIFLGLITPQLHYWLTESKLSDGT